MTNTNNNRPRCIDCNVQLNSRNTTIDSSRTNRMCDICYDLASLENDHQDGHHEDEAVADCLMCDPGDRSKPSNVVKAHTKGSHAACYAAEAHDKTREGRAACRKARNA